MKEKVIHYFTTMQHAEIIKLYNKNLNIKCIINGLLSHHPADTEKWADIKGVKNVLSLECS